ncbi:hypothetical protein BU26DRAFT_326210 [Trematosphaeria pertusa]|uniref:Uncharacterized protein n=1 Tax=Trematosphaeria pertusa TaxID=390896 RepID=A0A6A6IDC0_9PLEO|nr:uncharacterized protein BU26DRAFT_326210 [Trematosphaeria pertusa]KAF2248058.1 hypothetical protein BU26DRAFT_326210 [Trematosphaeria pertusa]
MWCSSVCSVYGEGWMVLWGISGRAVTAQRPEARTCASRSRPARASSAALEHSHPPADESVARRATQTSRATFTCRGE